MMYKLCLKFTNEEDMDILHILIDGMIKNLDKEYKKYIITNKIKDLDEFTDFLNDTLIPNYNINKSRYKFFYIESELEYFLLNMLNCKPNRGSSIWSIKYYNAEWNTYEGKYICKIYWNRYSNMSKLVSIKISDE